MEIQHKLTPYEQSYGAPVNAKVVSTTTPANEVIPPTPPIQADTIDEKPSASANSTTTTKPRKKWPWVLACCLVGLVMLLGGCVGGIAVAKHLFVSSGAEKITEDIFSENKGSNSDNPLMNELYKYLYGDTATDELSLDDIQRYFGVGVGNGKDGKYGQGLYKVGSTGNDIAPGLYYLEGSNNKISHYLVFSPVDADADEKDMRYKIDDSVEYFGNYYAEVAAGQVIAFMPAKGSLTMRAASKDAEQELKPPYVNGCYRVGIDIPAGEYAISIYPESAAAAGKSEPGAFVMKDMLFNDDSIIESAYVIRGSRQTITVKDGEYLELFAAKAAPVE